VQAPKPVTLEFDPNQARQSVQEAVSILNQQIQRTNRGLGFRMDEILNSPVVTVVSESTGEVVRQIPNEVVVRVAHNIERMKGLFFNSKA
jgi:flagellar protein FlaG